MHAFPALGQGLIVGRPGAGDTIQSHRLIAQAAKRRRKSFLIVMTLVDAEKFRNCVINPEGG
jgi:hypothetical protein